MIDPNASKSWLRLVAWIVGIATLLLVGGYLTSDQWIAVVKGLIG
jgi:hypothetical protein